MTYFALKLPAAYSTYIHTYSLGWVEIGGIRMALFYTFPSYFHLLVKELNLAYSEAGGEYYCDTD